MSALVKMWSNTRMVVLCAVSSALYVALLIPFKFVQIIPGLAELRPAGAIPPTVGLLFGPAGAFGAGFGNLIGDFFGTLGPGSLFGLLGNFLYGYIPYKVYQALSREDFSWKMGIRSWLALLIAIALGGTSCAVVIGFGLELLGIVPFKVIANWISFNNLLFGLSLGPVILLSTFSYIKNAGLFYKDIISDVKKSRYRLLGVVLIFVGVIIALGLGNFPELANQLWFLGLEGKNLLLANLSAGLGLIILGSVLV